MGLIMPFGLLSVIFHSYIHHPSRQYRLSRIVLELPADERLNKLFVFRLLWVG